MALSVVSRETTQAPHVLVALCLALAQGCAPASDEGLKAAPAPRLVPPPSLPALQADADARLLSAPLERALTEPRTDLRAAATLLVARTPDPAALPLLVRALLDEAPSVRQAAALGIALQDAPADQRERHLLSALAAEPIAALRLSIRRDLALVSPDPTAPWLPDLGADPPGDADCRTLALMAARGAPPSVSVVTRALPDQPGAAAAGRVDPDCLWALTRAPEGPRSEPQRQTLRTLARQAADAPDVELQALALRLAPALGPIDESWIRSASARGPLRPAVAAAEVAAQHAGVSVLLDLIRDQQQRLLGDPAQFYSWRVPWLLHALDLAAGFSDAAEVRTLAEELLDAFAPEAPSPGPRAFIHCAAARLADRCRRWPGRVESCGGAAMPASARAVAAAQVLGATTGSDELRATYLERLYERGPVEARAAVLDVLPSLDGQLGVALLERGLAEGPALATHALQAIARGAPIRPESTRDAVVAALGPEPPPRLALAWLAAARTLSLQSERAALVRLASDPNVTVRQAALALAREWGWPLPPPTERRGRARDALPADRFPEPGARFDVLLDTTAGPIRLALDLDTAPATCVRFMELVRAGHYDGRHFDSTATGALVSVAPDFPDADAAPAPTLRSELAKTAFALGTVGMADDGRDTAIGQFFVSLGRQPELDYRFTAFAQVTEGAERLQLLHAGHRIREARVLVSRATEP